VWTLNFVPLADERGAVIGGMVIAQDITESLAAIGFKLEQARLRLRASGSPEVDELLWQVTKDLSAEVSSLRRTIGRLRPLVPVEDGLEAALREEAKSACNRAALVTCEIVSELEGRLDPVVETALFRVAQQALADVAHFGLIAMPERVEAKLPLTDPAEGSGA
jgi:signal transduction histidine kinase